MEGAVDERRVLTPMVLTEAVVTSPSMEPEAATPGPSSGPSPVPSSGPSSIRERTIAENSLVILLQGLHGQVTTVDLRDESAARGRVVNVDAFMNVRLAEVLYRDRRGRLARLEDLFITGRNIRYVHVPDHVDMMQTIESQLAKIRRVRSFPAERGGRKEYAKKN